VTVGVRGVLPRMNISNRSKSMQSGKSLVAVFDKQTHARQALDAVLQAGFSSSQARLTSPESTKGEAASDHHAEDKSFGEKIASFLGFGSEHESTYSEAVRRGGHVLVVETADENETERAFDIIERFGPVDIDERQAEWRQAGWQPAQAEGGGTTIPVVEEELQVGKRTVERGGVRVIARTVSTPVEETLNLREEHASVERRPADRAATDSEQQFEEQSIEVRSTAEEAVVGKTARVVEDVVVGKESTTQQQAVKDNVRKTQVDVQPVATGSGNAQKPARERRKSGTAYKGMERRSI
jgi:uncharacterized protein (TIGR02271 family)